MLKLFMEAEEVARYALTRSSTDGLSLIKLILADLDPPELANLAALIGTAQGVENVAETALNAAKTVTNDLASAVGLPTTNAAPATAAPISTSTSSSGPSTSSPATSSK